MIAMEHVKLDEFPAVIDWLDKTLALNPDYHYAYFQKAKALSQLGDDDAATTTLKLGIVKAQQAGDGKAVSELSELMTSINS
jgi:tetratricopeptide (TPR) repeat protein